MNTYCNTEIKKINDNAHDSNGVRLQKRFGSFQKRSPDLCKTIVCVKQIVGIAQIVSGWNGSYKLLESFEKDFKTACREKIKSTVKCPRSLQSTRKRITGIKLGNKITYPRVCVFFIIIFLNLSDECARFHNSSPLLWSLSYIYANKLLPRLKIT